MLEESHTAADEHHFTERRGDPTVDKVHSEARSLSIASVQAHAFHHRVCSLSALTPISVNNY